MLLRLLKTFSVVVFLALASHTSANSADGMVDINTASAAEMADAISGVGIKKAERIVAYRTSKGPFSNVSELAAVKGIGVNIIEKNLHLLRVSEQPSAR